MGRYSRGFFWMALLIVMPSAAVLRAQWSESPQGLVGPETQRVGAICFRDGILWAGAESLYFSTDTGKTWNPTSFPQPSNISDIAFYDSLNGLVGTYQDGVYLTQDGGLSWVNVVSPTGQPFCRVSFNGSPSVMHALNIDGTIYTSTDGGSPPWTPWQFFGGGFSVEGLSFAIGADKTIFVFSSGASGGWINYSSDLGATWSGNGTNNPDADSQGLAADSCDINRLYLVNENSKTRQPDSTKIFITPDGGQTWQVSSNHLLDFFSGSIANTAQAVYVTTVPTSKSGVLRSTDAGASWQNIGGPNTSYDTRSIALANNNIIFVLDSNGTVWTTLNSGGDSLDLGPVTRGNPLFVVSGNPAKFKSSVCGPLDSEMFVGVLSCSPATATIDSISLSGSPAFSLSGTESLPRTVTVSDSISLRYWSTSAGADTARLQIAFHLSGSAFDTTIILIGSSSQSNATSTAGASRELISTSFGASANLRLLANVSPGVNIDSLWPFLQSADLAFFYDSSRLEFSSYNPPSGWNLISALNSGTEIYINIRNVSSSAVQPLDLGTVNFLPIQHTGSLTRLPLDYLVLYTKSGHIPLCIERQEDDIWAIEVYPASDVEQDKQQDEQDIQVFPNPADNELWIRNTADSSAMIMLSDALGRELISETIPGNSTDKLDLESLPSSSYILTCHVNDRTFIRRVAKLR